MPVKTIYLYFFYVHAKCVTEKYLLQTPLRPILWSIFSDQCIKINCMFLFCDPVFILYIHTMTLIILNLEKLSRVFIPEKMHLFNVTHISLFTPWSKLQNRVFHKVEILRCSPTVRYKRFDFIRVILYPILTLVLPRAVLTLGNVKCVLRDVKSDLSVVSGEMSFLFMFE